MLYLLWSLCLHLLFHHWLLHSVSHAHRHTLILPLHHHLLLLHHHIWIVHLGSKSHLCHLVVHHIHSLRHLLLLVHHHLLTGWHSHHVSLGWETALTLSHELMWLLHLELLLRKSSTLHWVASLVHHHGLLHLLLLLLAAIVDGASSERLIKTVWVEFVLLKICHSILQF